MKSKTIAIAFALLLFGIGMGTYILNLQILPSDWKKNRKQSALSTDEIEPASGKGDSPNATEEKQAGSEVGKILKLGVPLATPASEDAIFTDGWKSSVSSISYSRQSIAKNGNVLLVFPDRVDNVRESPDQKMFVSYGPPHGWQIHRITESGCVKVEDNLPKNEDLQLYWIDNQNLVGVSVIYEAEMRPGMEDGFAENTRLFVYDVGAAKSRDLDTGVIKQIPGSFIRIDAFSADGFIKLSLVNSDQYFSGDRIRDLGIFQISTE